MIKPCYYRISVKGVAVDETGRFLLTREDNGQWEFLGGGLDHGEDPIDGLKREIKEEAGLEVTDVSPTPKYFLTVPFTNEQDGYCANVLYEIKLKDLNFTPSEECQELRYCTAEEARALPLFPNVEKFLDIFDPDLHKK